MKELIAERRRHPKEDLISTLIAAENQGEILNEEEIISTVLLVTFGGFETTKNLIGNGILTLLKHPQELQKLRKDPSLMRGAIGEILRYESPLQRTSRSPTCDLELGGQQIKQGSWIFLFLSSANRDPEQYPDPNRFDISRDTRKHLAFAYGNHVCPGSSLAMLEAQVVFTEILARFPIMTLLDSEPDWQPNLTTRTLKQLNIKFT